MNEDCVSKSRGCTVKPDKHFWWSWNVQCHTVGTHQANAQEKASRLRH